MGEIQNPHHDHPFNMKLPYENQDIYCDGCDRSTLDDDPFLQCTARNCPFQLHKSCASLPPQISDHSFHPHHTLNLLYPPPSDRESFQCDACSKNAGFTFHCADCNYNLDVCCSQLIQKEIFNEDNGFDGKSHSWIICDSSSDKFKVLCSACKLPVENPVYVCLECKLSMHKSCTQLPKTIRHPFHQPHTLVLTRWVGKDVRRGLCDFCHNSFDDSIGYSCQECVFKLDYKCASLLVAKTYKFHEHPLVLVPTHCNLACYLCRCKDCAPILHCIDKDCEVNFHLHCVPSLPRVVEYHNHIHPLTLTGTQIKDQDDEMGNEDFYCDACEEIRLLPDPTYYCKECHYVAHVRCLISDEDLLELGTDFSAIGQEDDGHLGASTSKEVNSIISEILALRAELEKLKEKRVRKDRFIALYEDPNYVVDLDA
ncbi:uncharacterized protein LOC124932972 [Impatiens glandulifera]|uniref:uncharacterized protein LOC124932972 n=1 Tax=Impatiens glandulifera TaxID=253017 RepID=UPI001FB0F560|nr:uncharacterized protein LOC124932972 [Impatiens glandulifera]